MHKAIGFAAILSFTGACFATDYQTDLRLRQAEIDRRMSDIQQDMTSQSNAIQSSISQGVNRDYNPASISTGTVPRVYKSATPEPGKVILEMLGSPEAGTGIYAHPPEERLYHYGKILIELGYPHEGIRAITEHTRIQAEAAMLAKRKNHDD
ncbi:MAG: hypothetical protein ISP91_04070 [Pseudomonadales bacterium]|jgi:hypothetical protein|nr:hypothetical protein [Pseudomonadales bacterium]